MLIVHFDVRQDWFRLPRMVEAHVDNIIRHSQEVSRWSAEDLGSVVVS